jgi:murein DD-endopeptidase MepM/ murein hydrolase activator NlpD
MRKRRGLLTMVLLTILAVAMVYFIPQEATSLVPHDQNPEAVDPGLEEDIPPELLYGIPVFSYQLIKGEVRQGQSLAELLLPHGVSAQQLYQMSMLPDGLLDERRIRPGNKFTLFNASDSTPAMFVYEKDPLNYVTIYLDSASVRAENGIKPVEQRIIAASGTIETSLWESMVKADANPILALELSEIFAWTIDFFGIQQGDQFKVIYEESYVDSSSIGINRILGAWFWHNNNDFWAIPFEQNEVLSFYDEEGNSLRKAFLKAPLRFSRISSGYSNSRYHPVLKIRRPHHGVDYAARTGTPVYTVGDGIVTKVGYQKRGGGNYVKIKHNSVYSTTYMHLSRFGKDIRQGRYVKQGDVIGYVGATGLATGPHLDFRFYKNGSPVNPLKVEAPPVEPVFEENLPDYNVKKGLVIGVLKLIK